MATFVPDPDRGYAVMNPIAADAKYSRKNTPLTLELVGGALSGEATRRLPINDKWQTLPVSLAVNPEHRDGWAKAAMIDVDAGNTIAVQRVFATCSQHGLWAFAQLGESAEHAGGHVYIPAAAPEPTSLLLDLARRIQAVAKVSGESYPSNVDLRLPLMLHLRAPGGPRRFPLLLPSGELISADDAISALQALRDAFQPNSTQAITAALATLPLLTLTNRTRIHRSKVNPRSDASVINWYNDNYDLEDLLTSVGAHGIGRSAILCPWHRDRDPSLVLWNHKNTGRLVCRCFSQNSACPAADQPFMDSFNVYCLMEGLTTSEAVKQLSEEYGLGNRRTLQVTRPTSVVHTPTDPAAVLAEHQVLIATARDNLKKALRAGADRGGRVAVIRATPGLGKTHAAAELANELHRAGKVVAVAAPTLDMAQNEWAPRLANSFIWRSRLDICTCYPRNYLAELTAKGYALPDCFEGCPYASQRAAKHGKIIIYQHNHIHLNNGELLTGVDTLIVDESPLGSLLEEHSAAHDDIRRLGNRLSGKDDPALPLLRALWQFGRANTRSGTSIYGTALLDALKSHVENGDLDAAITAAQQSPCAQLHPVIEQAVPDATLLPKQFLGKLISALAHDACNSGEHNSLLSWARGADGAHGWYWYERHTLMKSSAGKLIAPAILILDGSADRLICEQLYRPWSVDVVVIDVPLSQQLKLSNAV